MIPTNKGKQTPKVIIDDLTYGCYAFNRNQGMTAEYLLNLFPRSGEAMEQRYQKELKHANT